MILLCLTRVPPPRPGEAAPLASRRRIGRARLCFALGLILLLVLPAAFGQAHKDAVQVLVLTYGNKESPAVAAFVSGFRSALEEQMATPVWIYTESLGEPSVGHDPGYERMMVQTLKKKYGRGKIHLPSQPAH